MEIDQFIYNQGWSFWGVAGYEALEQALKKHEGVFERWIEAGFQAKMDYLEAMEEDRFHPKNKLPDVKSVIVLAGWYGYEQKKCSINEGKVARYAAGRDYHKVLKKKLIELSDFIDGHSYISVDSGPTVDRVLAEAAGLGFFGKNSCLINPSRGSYFFIASVMTNLELPIATKPQMPTCGDCSKCQNACPTGAIKEPGMIDANHCISYLTIENKEGIPVELRHQIGNRLFGCDICQEVCPFNIGRAAKQEVLIEDLTSKNGVGESLSLSDLLAIKIDEEFTEKFAGTPLMRAKRRGLLRNACVVAGNSGDTSLITDLQNLIGREEDEMLLEHADWAIQRLKGEVG